MTAKKRAPLTDYDIAVLIGAKDGRLRRSHSSQDLYASYLKAHGRETKVNRQVDKLSHSDPRTGDEALIEIGTDDARWSRPWLLTDAGEAELAKREGAES